MNSLDWNGGLHTTGVDGTGAIGWSTGVGVANFLRLCDLVSSAQAYVRNSLVPRPLPVFEQILATFSRSWSMVLTGWGEELLVYGGKGCVKVKRERNIGKAEVERGRGETIKHDNNMIVILLVIAQLTRPCL